MRRSATKSSTKMAITIGDFLSTRERERLYSGEIPGYGEREK
jgi:hypothetical protein